MPFGRYDNGQYAIRLGQGDMVMPTGVTNIGCGVIGFEQIEEGEIGREVKWSGDWQNPAILLSSDSIESLDILVQAVSQLRAKMVAFQEGARDDREEDAS